jgi:hypothetical protein
MKTCVSVKQQQNTAAAIAVEHSSSNNTQFSCAAEYILSLQNFFDCTARSRNAATA